MTCIRQFLSFRVPFTLLPLPSPGILRLMPQTKVGRNLCPRWTRDSKREFDRRSRFVTDTYTDTVEIVRFDLYYVSSSHFTIYRGAYRDIIHRRARERERDENVYERGFERKGFAFLTHVRSETEIIWNCRSMKRDDINNSVT